MAEGQMGGTMENPHHVRQVPIRTSWENLYRQDMFVQEASPVHCFHDRKARYNWTVVVSLLGSNLTGATVTGVLEFTTDGTIFNPMGASITANATTPSAVQNIANFAAEQFRFRPTSVAMGSAQGYRVGLVAAGS